MQLINASHLQLILSWIEVNTAWSGLIIFLICLSESLAVIGLFIPGLFIMGAIGGLISIGTLQLAPTLMWAILGAISGDSISYAIGCHFKETLPTYWPFSRSPHWLHKGKTFFKKYGSMSIVIGRFVGPVRPFIPVVAGIMSMCPKRFLISNIVSAILWAPIYIFPGALFSWVAKSC